MSTADFFGENFDPYELDNGDNPNHEISHGTQMFCEQIEADRSMIAACNCAEKLAGADVKLDSTETVIKGEEIAIRDRVDSTVWVNGTDEIIDVMRKRQRVHQTIADAMGRQVADMLDGQPEAEPAIVFERVAMIVALAAFWGICVMAWWVW